MYQTIAVAVVVLMLGNFLKHRIAILERFCIPAPVIGGVIFAIFTCVCYVTGFAEFSFDDILKEVCMVFFFTSVGFQANLKVLKSGGKSLIIFLILVIMLIICQNFLAVGLSKALQISPLVGLCTGSIPMIGGHGTAGAFGPVLEDFGVKGASTLCTAAATFGLIAGSIMGGPVGKRLIEKKNLLKTAIPEDNSLLIEEEKKHERHTSMYPAAVFQLIIAMGIGTIISKLLSMTGMTFPIYIGAMIAAAFMRNIGEYSGQFTIYMGEINDIGGISLSLFLGIAMITLKLWQLADLALPLITLLAGQTILMFLFTYFVIFNIMGRDYDAAVLSSGVCGFGMGATPNAMANMQGSYQVVVKDLSVIEKIATAYETINAKPLQDGTLYLLSLKECYDFDLKCDEEKQIEIYKDILESFEHISEAADEQGNRMGDSLANYYADSKAYGKGDFIALNGGLFFLGVLLGAVFLFGTVLIMYYKQISEGYEDQDRFNILMKVGMTKKEVKQTINSQVLTVFFMPLIMAGIHLAFAFPMIQKILMLMSGVEAKVFVIVTIGCYLVFALFYVLVYVVTSKSYYTIISSKEK